MTPVKEFLPRLIARDCARAEAKIRSWLNSYLRPRIAGWEAQSEVDPAFLHAEILAELNRQGFLSLWMPKILGGRGLHPYSMNIFHREVAQVCLGVTNIVGAHYAALLLLSLTRDLRALRDVISRIRAGEKSGKAYVLATAVTDPSAGTDYEDPELFQLGKFSCKAERDPTQPGGYRVSGSKAFISNGPWCAEMIALFPTAQKDFVVTRIAAGASGVSIGRPEKKLGQHLCPASQIFFDNVAVLPEHVVLCPEHFATKEAFSFFAENLNRDFLTLSRASVAMMANGVMDGVAEELNRYAPKRGEDALAVGKILAQAFQTRFQAESAARQVNEHGPFRETWSRTSLCFSAYVPQWIQSMLGKLLTTRAFSRRARDKLRLAAKQTHAEELLKIASAAKWRTAQVAHRACLSAMQFLGNSPALNKSARDSLLLQIYEGTTTLNQRHAGALRDSTAESIHRDFV